MLGFPARGSIGGLMAMKRGCAELIKTDVCLSAHALIADHGSDAKTSANTRIAQMREINNVAGVVRWSQILTAIQQIQSSEH